MQNILWKVQPTESIQIVAQRKKTLYLQRTKIGESNTLELEEGMYYVKEKKAPKWI